MGKPRVIAETGAGQHGVATATVAALLGQECVVYMGERTPPPAPQRRAHTAARHRCPAGGHRHRDPQGRLNEALGLGRVGRLHPLRHPARWSAPTPTRSWSGSSSGSSATRPAPRSWRPRAGCPTWRWPASAGGRTRPACSPPSSTTSRCGWSGWRPAVAATPGDHGASLGLGEAGILHGARSYVLQDPDGQVLPTHSVSAGLDYPGVGPEHAFWKDAGRVAYERASDSLALDGFRLLARTEGLPRPRTRPRRRLAGRGRRLGRVAPGTLVVLNLSGRGDKDVETVSGLWPTPRCLT